MSLPIDLVRDRSGLWRSYLYDEIYMGPNSAGRHVPNPKDVINRITDTVLQQFVVLSVDPDTAIPTLAALSTRGSGVDIEPADILFAPTIQTYRLMVDKSVTPHEILIDSQAYIFSIESQYCRIYKGKDISESGQVISSNYDSTGLLIGQNIPLVLVAADRYTNNAGIKVAKKAWTSENLENGDVVTAVFFSNSGVRLSVQELIVFETGFIASSDRTAKAVQSIELKSQFLSASNSSVLNYPLNLPINALDLIGVVNYTDGSRTEMAVDGSRFTIEGLEAFAPTILGQPTEVTLKYKLQPNEVAYGASVSQDRHFSSTYTIVTTASDGTYAVQLYGYPEWVSAQAGYRLKWSLLDLDRSINYDVTSNVVIDETTPFVSTLYGQKQILNVSVNLKSVNVSYNRFTHVQMYEIILNAAGTNRPAKNAINNWQVATTANSRPLFGNGVYATAFISGVASSTLRLIGDASDQADWLNRWYYNTKPLKNPQVETQPPAPTHFKISVEGFEATYPVSQWNQVLNVNKSLTNNATLHVTFIRRTPEIDLIMSRAAAPVWHVDATDTYV
jgi:hypothetical protein